MDWPTFVATLAGAGAGYGAIFVSISIWRDGKRARSMDDLEVRLNTKIAATAHEANGARKELRTELHAHREEARAANNAIATQVHSIVDSLGREFVRRSEYTDGLLALRSDIAELRGLMFARTWPQGRPERD